MLNDFINYLKFLKLTYKDESKALDKFEKEKSTLIATPLIILLPIIFITIPFASSFKWLIFFTVLLLCVLLLYHYIIMTIYDNKLYNIEIEKNKRESNRIKEEQERMEEEVRQKKLEEQLKRVREWQRKHKEEEGRNKRHYEQQYQEWYNARPQKVDQNMINAMKLLELKEDFTERDIKSAYRRLSKIHHPDVKGGSAENFKRLNKAYKYIMDRI